MSDFSKDIRQYVLSEGEKEPIVFQGLHSLWAPVLWSMKEWGDFIRRNLNDDSLTVRAGLKKHLREGIQWEADCKKVRTTWDTLMCWDAGGEQLLNDGTSNETHWLYFDYNYMSQILSKEGQEMFMWEAPGFPERNGSQSTLWIGTAGAYTPCHYDTYGCNLVTQVIGRKTWTLFPPRDTDNLRPTRIPYEESSVYSQVNMLQPSASDLVSLSRCKALQVTLNPGDVLYVPPKWWHFVLHDEVSISVNTWIEMPQDTNTRLEEAILKSLVGGVASIASISSVSELLNPNEAEVLELNEEDINSLLDGAVRDVLRRVTGRSAPGESSESLIIPFHDKLNSFSTVRPESSPPLKLSRTSIDESNEVSAASPFRALVGTVPGAIVLAPKSFPDHENPDPKMQDTAAQSVASHRSPLARLINSIGHPTLLKQIASNYLASYNEDLQAP